MFGKDIWFMVVHFLDAKDRCTLTHISKYINNCVGKIIKKFRYNKFRVQYKRGKSIYPSWGRPQYYNVVMIYQVDYRNRIQGILTKYYIEDKQYKGNLITNTMTNDIIMFGTLGSDLIDKFCTNPDKSWHYIDNQKHGWNKELYSKRFMWKNLLHGPLIDNGYYKSRKIYKLGVLHGYYIYFGECDDTIEGNYINGCKNGPWIIWAIHEPNKVAHIDMYEMGILKSRSGYYISKKHRRGRLNYYTEFKTCISDASEIETPDDDSGTIWCCREGDTTDYTKYHLPNITRHYKKNGTEYRVVVED